MSTSRWSVFSVTMINTLHFSVFLVPSGSTSWRPGRRLGTCHVRRRRTGCVTLQRSTCITWESLWFVYEPMRTGITPTGCWRNSALIKMVRDRNEMKTSEGRARERMCHSKCSGRLTGKTFYTQAFAACDLRQCTTNHQDQDKQALTDYNHKEMSTELWATLLGKITFMCMFRVVQLQTVKTTVQNSDKIMQEEVNISNMSTDSPSFRNHSGDVAAQRAH